MITRILIVEDILAQREGMDLQLRKISDAQKHAYGIDSFVIDKAASLNSAQERLTEAVNTSIRYDIMILDLGLPLTDGGKDMGPGVGLEVLDIALSKQAAQVIIVITVWEEPKLILGAFRGGVVDYLIKPKAESEFSDLIERVLLCWVKIVTDKSNRAFTQRLRTLVPYAEQSLAHSFSVIASNFFQPLQIDIDALAQDICERHGLDSKRDTNDPLLRRLAGIKEAVDLAIKEWKSRVASLGLPDTKPTTLAVQDLLKAIQEEIAPCLIAKGVEIEFSRDDRNEVTAFGREVEVVLKEILLGALNGLPNHLASNDGARQTVKVTISKAGSRVCVRFEDHLGGICSEDTDSINKGHPVPPGERFGRSWGLAVVQRVVLRGGGKIVVEPPQKEGKPSVVIYEIPAA